MGYNLMKLGPISQWDSINKELQDHGSCKWLLDARDTWRVLYGTKAWRWPLVRHQLV